MHGTNFCGSYFGEMLQNYNDFPKRVVEFRPAKRHGPVLRGFVGDQENQLTIKIVFLNNESQTMVTFVKVSHKA